MGYIDVVFVGDPVAFHLDDLAFVDRNHLRPLRPRDLGHIALVALHPAADHRQPQIRSLRRKGVALLVTPGQLAQLVDRHVEPLLAGDFLLQGSFFLLGELLDVGTRRLRIFLQAGPLRGQAALHRIQRPLLPGQPGPLDGHLLRKRHDLLHLPFPHGRHLPQIGDAAGHLIEVARREEVGQIIVVFVVAVCLAHHLGIAPFMGVERCRQPPGHAVRTGHLDLELTGIPLRHVEQLVARIDLTGQTAHRLLGRGTSLLELRNLLFLPGDLLFEVGDQPFLRRDLLVGILGRKRPCTK